MIIWFRMVELRGLGLGLYGYGSRGNVRSRVRLMWIIAVELSSWGVVKPRSHDGIVEVMTFYMRGRRIVTEAVWSIDGGG